MAKIAYVSVLPEKVTDARVKVAAGRGAWESWTGAQRMIVNATCDDLGRISADAQAVFDALLAAGDLACADDPDLPALNTDAEGGNPRGLENSMRTYGS